MAEIAEVGLVDGVPTTGTGEAPTLVPVRDALGTVADAAVAAGAAGSISAKLRLATSQLATLAGHLDGVEAALAAVAQESGGNLAAHTTLLTAIDTTLTASLTALGAIQTSVQALDNAIAGSELQVDIVSSALPADAATETTLAALAVSLATIDDWDETNRAAVNLIAGGVGVQGASGVVTAITQRVVLATDVPLPAGTNAIGKLAANDGVDIGNVDVASVPADPFGLNADAAAVDGSISAKLRAIATTGIPVTALPASTNTIETVGDVAHDAPAAGNPVLMGARASAAAPTNVSADNDAVQLWALRSGALAIQATFGGNLSDTGNGSASAGSMRVTIANDSTGVLAAVGALTEGGVAHDAADSGKPHKIGAKAIAALSGATLVAAADRTDAQSDLDGALLVRDDAALGDLVNGNATNTDGSSTQVLAAGAAGIRHYITDVTICNSSASNITVDLKDGTTVKWSFPVPANGGVTHSFRKPLGGTAATAWNFDPSAAASTITCSVSGFKSKI